MYLSLMFSLWKMPEMREKVICCVQNIFIPPTMLFWLLASELNMKCKMKSVVVMIGGWGALSPIPAISIYFHSPQLTESLDYYRYVLTIGLQFICYSKRTNLLSCTLLLVEMIEGGYEDLIMWKTFSRATSHWQLLRINPSPGLLWNSWEWLFVSN